MAKPDTWMPLKIEPWTKKTARLSAAERGAYMDLLLAYWTGGPLPADDEDTLKRLSRCTDKEWKQVRSKVLAYFTRDGDVLRQSRADEELADAKQRYERRASAGKAGGEAKAKQAPKQKPSNATANDQASYILHSSIDEVGANAPTRKPRRTRLAKDWQPSAGDYQFALAANLTHAEIAADLIEFVGYWTGPEPSKPTKIDWSKTYRNHITDYAPRIIARRPRGGKAFHDAKRGGGLASYLRESLVEEPLPGGSGVPGFGSDVSDGSCSASGFRQGESDSGSIIDADEWQRTAGAVDEVTGADSLENRDGRGPEADDGNLSRAASAVSGGRGEVCIELGDGQCGMVAGVGGFEIEAGHIHEQTASDASGDDYGNIPAFLDRRGSHGT